jgi:hypothetical protein
MLIRRATVQPKQIATRLNKSLDELGVPTDKAERSAILAKMLNIPRHEARSLLEGLLLPNDELCAKISQEFEIDLPVRHS